ERRTFPPPPPWRPALALDRRRHLGLAHRRSGADVWSRALARGFFFQEPRATCRVPADPPALPTADRAGRGPRRAPAPLHRHARGRVAGRLGRDPAHRHQQPDGGPGEPGRADRRQYCQTPASALGRLRHRQLCGPARRQQLSPVPLELGLRDGDRDGHHTTHEQHGRLCAVQVRFPRPQRSHADHRRDSDGAPVGDPCAALCGGERDGAPRLPLGGDPADGRHAHGRFPPSAVHAHDPRRASGGRADGPCLGMADLLADRAAAHGARTRRAGHLLGGLALERLPVAADRAVAARTLHPSGRAQHLCGRTQRSVALYLGYDRGDHAPGGLGFRVPPALHHNRHRRCRHQM
ncbi:MAG: Domain of unknown function / ABC transporter, permease protein 2 (cluster 1, maltose/g3p/polyamine/iron), partial [uncultured Rubellimicrobium sp.]